MKISNILKFTALSGVLFAMTGCSEDKILTVDPYGIPEVGNYNIDVQVDPATNTFTLQALDQNGQPLKGAYPIWRVYANARNPQTPSARSTSQVVTGVIKQKGDYAVELQLGNRNGISEGVRTGTIHIDRDLKDPNKFYGYKYDSEFNLWKNANVSLASTWFANNDWAELNPQPSVSVSNEFIELHTPADMGGNQWQGQVHIATDIEVSSAETYDFSIYLESQVASNVTVKVQKDGDDNTFFTADVQEFKAGGSAWHFEDMPGFDGTLKIALDFGGNPDIDFSISNIVFKNHKNDDGTVWPSEGGGNEGPAEFNGFVYDSPVNLWKNANVAVASTWFSGDNWDGGVAAPEIELANDYMSLHVPAETGPEQWKGQVHVSTDIEVSAANHYDFSCHVNVPVDGKVTIKVQKDGDDNSLFEGMGDQKTVKAGDNVIYFVDKPGFDGTLKIAFDFGGLADQDVEISNIVFKNHADDDGTVLPGAGEEPSAPVTWCDPSSDLNLWNAAQSTMEFYYATGSDWSPLPAPEFFEDGNYYELDLPTATVAQWQAQVKYHTLMATTADKNYDFRITFESSTDHGGITVKLTDDGDDNNFYMAEQVSVSANSEQTFSFVNMPGKDIAKLMLVLDFGGNADGTHVVIKDIIFQEHAE